MFDSASPQCMVWMMVRREKNTSKFSRKLGKRERNQTCHVVSSLIHEKHTAGDVYLKPCKTALSNLALLYDLMLLAVSYEDYIY